MRLRRDVIRVVMEELHPLRRARRPLGDVGNRFYEPTDRGYERMVGERLRKIPGEEGPGGERSSG